MGRRRWVALLLTAVAFGAAAAPGAPAPVAAAEFTLESSAHYEIRADAREIGVRVTLEFTNTTPDPAGQFSIFEAIRLAVHDQAADLAASDEEGALSVQAGSRGSGDNRVHVATIQLREGIRYQDSVSVELTYVLPDSNGGQLRVRPSLSIFPAWAFGTSGEVSVSIPAGYEMRVDGDPLTEDGGDLVSGQIDDPQAWLALVSAVGPAEHASHETTVPLDGGTADLVVRAFPDDEEWGTQTLATVAAALPLIEAELGLPYPLRGQLILVESVPATTAGFGESSTTGTEIPVSFDQPPFTALHQVTHVWLPPTLVEARWISEGLASQVAAAAGEELDVELPFDPAEEARAHDDASFQLDAWSATPDPEADAFGYAFSWRIIDVIAQDAGEDAIPGVLARVAAGIGPYEQAEVAPEPAEDGAADPDVPLNSRSFLDQLEAVSDADLGGIFANWVLTQTDIDLLEARAEARAEFDALAGAADGWGAPDPVAAAMSDWRFDEAIQLMTDARAWLTDRDALLAEMARAGLSPPERLRQAYRAYGGAAEAESELDREREFVDAYTAAADDLNAERSFFERLGLVGGPDPEAQLALANGLFTDGELQASLDAVTEAERIVDAAATSGIVRVISLLLVVVVGIGLVVVLFRRRAYTARP